MSTSSKLFVGNLSWHTTDDSLRDAFGAYGHVTDVIVMRDRDTGRSRGFGFVTLDNQTDAEKAIEQLNGVELDGRAIKVNLAIQRERSERSGGYGGNY
ncbi:hypothetical protein DFQ27_008425 [Actinomortierella ambigua]|uniref:RRM domain-containing protein n=1 Tax=Actinomortierella ambigua TaxID=1343610 RepID=A0A9P6PTU7_9FUNG|nr:hypothetical protein DFQ27_008425 [Actinomortierella ambigua]